MDSQAEEKIPPVEQIEERLGKNAAERRYLNQLLKLAKQRELMREPSCAE